MSLTASLHHHHKDCDELFATAEEAADSRSGDWPRLFQRLRAELEAHFITEEELLFPAFEAATGMTAGPAQVMRMEHAQMRELLKQMADAVGTENAARYGAIGETLLVLMQQHNMKEEHILYPMCDRSLGDAGLDVAGGLQQRRAAPWPA